MGFRVLEVVWKFDVSKLSLVIGVRECKEFMVKCCVNFNTFVYITIASLKTLIKPKHYTYIPIPSLKTLIKPK